MEANGGKQFGHHWVAAWLIDNPLTSYCVLKQLMNIIIHRVFVKLIQEEKLLNDA